jgi:hypothetical protein
VSDDVDHGDTASPVSPCRIDLESTQYLQLRTTLKTLT